MKKQIAFNRSEPSVSKSPVVTFPFRIAFRKRLVELGITNYYFLPNHNKGDKTKNNNEQCLLSAVSLFRLVENVVFTFRENNVVTVVLAKFNFCNNAKKW